MRPWTVLVLAVGAATLLPACGGHAVALPPEDLFVDLRTDAAVVEPGEPFDLEVRLIWRKDLEPPAWTEDLLAPLVVREIARTRREDAARIEEIRRYRAHLFTLEDAVVGPITLATTPPGSRARVVARSPAVRLRVMPVVDPEAPGEPELPLPLVAEPALPGRTLVLAGIACLVLGGVLAAAAVRRRRAAVAAPPPPSPFAPLLLRLEALGGRPPRDAEEERRQAAELVEILRAFACRRHAIPAFERTTREILGALAATPQVPQGLAARLGHAVPRLDAVVFGHLPFEEAERRETLDVLKTLIREDAS